ncbi:hypothetical protein [Rhodococcus opacus]|uniref:hypothetical protein n=1 Tax=Rhodococcus opacus TaxID=37919 RepID=UPI002236917E|nr:hypothetical protein [Rhodococcus opacus]UZG55656.1 hypothetical protein ONE62_37610 [Rhodococcus opacus]
MKSVSGIRNSLRILARSLPIAALILLPTAAAALPAQAAPAVVTDDTFTDIFDRVGPASYCSDGPLYNLTETFNFSVRTVDTSAGVQRVNLRYTVSVTGVPIDPGLPTVTATGASVGGLTSGPAESNSGQLLIKWSFSDGTQLTERSLFHYTFVNGDFTNFRVTCNSIP